MNWLWKWRIQKLLSDLPAGDRAYYLLQSHLGGLRNYSIEMHLPGALHLIRALEVAGQAVESSRIIEIGTGWVPTIPLVMYLNGAHSCHTYDISRLLNDDLTQRAIQQLCTDERLSARNDRLSQLKSMLDSAIKAPDVLNQCGITYRAPADAATTDLPDGCIDVVYSYNVLEHVAAPDIAPLLKEAHRVLRPGGVTAHVIDLSDHFSHADPSLTAVHFLQYTSSDYAKFNTRFQNQNRLRAPDWRLQFTQNGFEPIHWQTAVDQRSIANYTSLAIDESYANYSAEDNCTTGLTVVARRVDS